MTHASDDLKLTAVQHYFSETADVFQCSVTSLKRWVKRYRTTGSVSRKAREYIAYKVKNTHVRKAVELLKKHPTISMKSLTKRLKKKLTTFLSHLNGSIVY